MASPDVTPYVDLTLSDIDAQTIADRAVADAASKLPDWQPREGNTELVIVEAVALEVEELVFAVNRVPGAVLEVLLRLYGLERDAGAPATAGITFLIGDAGAHTIPAGTRVLLDLGDAVDGLELATDADLVIPAGVTSDAQRTALATATTSRTDGDGTAAGTALDVLDAVPYVDGAILGTVLTGARDPEDGAAFLARGSTRLQRLVSTLVLPAQFTAAALEEAYVGRASTLDRYDPGQVPATNRNGHVTVIAASAVGLPISAGDKVTLENKLEAQALASLDIHIIDPSIVGVDIDVTVVSDGTLLAATLQANILAALAAYMSPATWPFSSFLYRNELIALVSNVAGVDRVTALTLNGATADINTGGVGILINLASGSSVTVT